MYVFVDDMFIFAYLASHFLGLRAENSSRSGLALSLRPLVPVVEGEMRRMLRFGRERWKTDSLEDHDASQERVC